MSKSQTIYKIQLANKEQVRHEIPVGLRKTWQAGQAKLESNNKSQGSNLQTSCPPKHQVREGKAGTGGGIVISNHQMTERKLVKREVTLALDFFKAFDLTRNKN